MTGAILRTPVSDDVQAWTHGLPESHGHAPVILIVGGGYSGAALAIRLLEQHRRAIRIVIAEPRESLGRGQAYSTTDTAQLMNGPAGNFSVHPDDLTHLAGWVERNAAFHGIALPADGASGLFIPRGMFGRYVEKELQNAIDTAKGAAIVEHWRSDVIRLDRRANSGMEAEFSDGRLLNADLVVLATGVFPLEADPALAPLSDDGHLATPWDGKKLDRLSTMKDILIVGASLSMVDTVASLEARGFEGRYHVISRRGHVIEPVRPAGDPVDIIDPDAFPRTIRDLFSLIRCARKKLLEDGRDWQVIPLSLRPFILPLWQSATTVERLRFARHLRSLWDVSAHRAAPPSYAAVERAKSEGRFEARAARLVSASVKNDRIDVVVRPRRQHRPITISVDGIVDARGHQEHDWSRIKTPLIRQVLEHGLVRRHDTGFGIDATTDGHVIDRDGATHADLFAIGHPLRGVAWESSSLTELRAQAQSLAERLHAILDALETSATARRSS